MDGPKIIEPSGGLLVFIREDIPSRPPAPKFKLPSDIQILPIEVNFKTSKWLLVPGYRPPSKDKHEFNDHLSKLLDFYSNTYDNILVLGDFNMEPNKSPMKSLIDSHNLYNMINKPTCFKSLTGTCIDLMLTNKKYSFKNTQTFETGESDFHNMIYTMFKTTFVKLSPKSLKYRCYKNFEKAAFDIDLQNELNILNDPGNYSSFENTLNKVLNKHAPYKFKLVRGNNKPFINRDLRKAISTRTRLKNIADRTKNPSDIERYKKQRNFVKVLNFKTKRNFYRNLKPENLDMNKYFWKTFKVFLSDKDKSSEKLILVEDNNIITDDDELAKIFNYYFSNLATSLDIKSWPNPETLDLNEDPVSYAIRKYANHPSINKIRSQPTSISNTFEFHPFSQDEVAKEIKKLDSSKRSSGDIPIMILKNHINIYLHTFTNFLNAARCNGICPNAMKLADISPIFKKDDKTEKENYRPISILSPLSKVFERLLCNQILSFMQNKLSKYLCAYKKRCNTEDALLRLLENWRKHLDSKQIVGTILCDLSKAFDTLPHNLIIAKLSAYGMGNRALSLILSYLTDRKQRCKVGSSYSDWADVKMGVPQGSVLGPILFNIFINDLFLFLHESLICNFADDTSIYAHGNSVDEVVKKLEVDLKNVLTWFDNNSLVPNPKKFQFMILGTKSKQYLCLDINGKNTISSSEITLLGIKIDWKLQFNSHVKMLCTRANKKAGAISRLRSKLNTNQKILLYNSFMLSQFGYCTNVWMFHGKSVNNNINRIQTRSLRAVYNDFNSNNDQLMHKGNHVTVHQKNLRQLIVKVYKCLNNEAPELLNGIFHCRNVSHNLRIRNLLTLPNTNTLTYGIHSFQFRGSSSWNMLPDAFKLCISSSVLKSELKNHIVKCSCKICI